MAARKRKLGINDTWRERIQTSMLINRLTDHIVGKLKLESSQIKAIEILLRKTAPDLAQVDSNVNIVEKPEARVYPMGLNEPDDRFSSTSETMDSIH